MNTLTAAPIQPTKIHSMLLANDSPLVQEGLVALCKSNPRYQVTARVFDGVEASRRIEEDLPDIAVVDLKLPMRSGLEVIQSVKQANVPTKVIILAANEDRGQVAACLQAGASGFLLESASSQEFLEAFREVTDGGVFISSDLNLLESLSGCVSTERDPLGVLPRREFQVLSLLAEGLRVKAIADRLALSPATVATHRARLMRKLDIHNVAGLVKFVFERKSR